MIPLHSAASPSMRTGKYAADLRSSQHQLRRILRMRKALERRFRQRVHRDDVTTLAAAAFCSTDSMRGWFVPGFCPKTKIASACAKSSS